MAEYIDPNPEFAHADVGRGIQLSWSEHPKRPRQSFVVNRDTGEATNDDGSTVTAADGRVLQQALNALGENALGTTVFNRYCR